MEASLDLRGCRISLETGTVARQANGSVIVKQGRSTVLVTAVSSEEERPGIDFFPLTVEYRELFSSAGVIPHVYGKREGKLSDREILASRIIDRSIRPLFPKSYRCDTQIVVTLLSSDPEVDGDVLGLIGAAAALTISDIPWKGPAAGVRVAKYQDEFVINPSRSIRALSSLDLVVSSSPDGLMMVEGHANNVSEDELLKAMSLAWESVQPVFDLLSLWVKQLDVFKREMTVVNEADESQENEKYITAVRARFGSDIEKALDNTGKKQRYRAVSAVKKKMIRCFQEEDSENLDRYCNGFDQIKSKEVRRRICEDGRRLDGRKLTEVRPITGQVNWLDQPHGSALFSRGETQACVFCSLSTLKDSLRLQTVYGEEEESFFLHYSFPPYSVGETKPMRGPSRREIGHGNLAWRALKNVIPPQNLFPYAIRLFSEITESNGSSSMATVCGGCLALMDAGVPIESPIAGVAMGLIQEQNQYFILTDILGDEDHLGDMDFKVAGTKSGVTAIQMDNKIGNLPIEVLEKALQQARQGRLHILEKMLSICPESRSSLKETTPAVLAIQIRPDRIREVIGPQGKTIQGIIKDTKTEINVNDDGTICIYSANRDNAQRAKKQIEDLVKEAQIFHYYHAKVVSVKTFGVFVEILPGTEGLVHTSEWDSREKFDQRYSVKPGDVIPVKVMGVDEKGRIKLSRKEAIDAGIVDFEN